MNRPTAPGHVVHYAGEPWEVTDVSLPPGEDTRRPDTITLTLTRVWVSRGGYRRSQPFGKEKLEEA